MTEHFQSAVGEQAEEPVADESQRERALAPDQSFIVQAPAGSGKTELLTRRVLTLLASVDSPEEILAITFTRKAAAEMRHRIHSLLRAAGDGVKPEGAHEVRGHELATVVLQRNTELNWGLLENPQRLSLLTIDSLCASLTRQLPVMSNLGAPLITEEHAQGLYMSAVSETIQSGLVDGAEHATSTRALLFECDNRVQHLQNLLAQLLANRDQWLRYVPLTPGIAIDRESLQGSLSRIVEQRLNALVSLWPECLNEDFFSLLAHADYCVSGLNSGNSGEKEALRSGDKEALRLGAMPGAYAEDGEAWQALSASLLTQQGTLRRTVNKNVGFPTAAADAKLLGLEKAELDRRKKQFVGILENLSNHPEFIQQLAGVGNLPFEGYSERQLEVLEHVSVLLKQSVTELMWVFGQSGKCDFSEISQRAQRALGDPENPTDLALSMDYRIRHILVDEFQDTSISQFQLFEKLVAGWEEGDGRTFFAVGDPMQSIYRFRDAEVSLFTQAQVSGIGQVFLETLQLQVNFRSDPALVDWCNRVFSEVFPSQSTRIEGAVPFARSEAFRAAHSESRVELIPFAGDNKKLQAASIVETVKLAFATDPDQSVAILVRSKNHLTEIFSALRAAEITCQALEMESLANRPVVRDIKAIAFALMHLSDRISWLSLLRGPWCGLSLNELHVLVELDRQKSLWYLITQRLDDIELSVESRLRLQNFVQIMTPAVTRANREELVAWVESCWMKLGGPAVGNADSGNSADLIAADTALRILAELEAEAQLWDRRIVESRLGSLFAPPADVTSPYVQIMTIHKSKGLEFDTVILPNLGRRAGADRQKLLNWFELVDDGRETDLLLAPLNTSVEPTEIDKINKLIASYHSAREKNERVRLMYVAATRARKNLWCLGHTRYKSDNRLADPQNGSMLQILWPVVSSEFESVLATDDQPIEIQEHDAMKPPQLQRLQTGWSVPWESIPVDWQLQAGTDIMIDEFEVPEYLWAGTQASAIGVVVHRQLQRISDEGLAKWSVDRVQQSGETYRRLLMANGIVETEIVKCVARVVKALTQSLQDKRGQWVLSAEHTESRNELALSAVVNGVVENIVIDRTFVDENGICWIIDYKTGDHRGGAIGKFLDQEQQRYSQQLERYAAILRKSTDRKISLGLYFPLLQRWREWPSNV